MRRANTIPAAAKMIQLKSCWDLSALSRVIKSMGRHQVGTEPKSGVAILLDDGEKPALSDRVHHDLRIVPVSPLRNFGVIVDAAAILRLRAKLHMVWAAARAISTQMVKRQAFRDRSISLRPVPAMATPQLAITADLSVSVFTPRQFPASCFFVDDVLMLPAVAGVVHLRLTRDVPQPRKLGYRRMFAAATQAEAARISDTLGQNAVMSMSEAYVAPSYNLLRAVRSISNVHTFTTAAAAFTRWVWASRVIWPNRIATSFPFIPMALKISQRFAGNLEHTSGNLGSLRKLAASAHAKAGRVWRYGRWLAFWLKPGAVAVNETAAARKSAVGALRNFSASARARLAKIDLGHLISSKDLWFWLAGAQTLSQPFHCTVEVV
jgi:hypothetical protein